jgi:hypothetical protein
VSIQGAIPIIGVFGPAVNVSYPFEDNVYLRDGKVTYGPGIGGGISLTINHPFNT